MFLARLRGNSDDDDDDDDDGHDDEDDNLDSWIYGVHTIHACN